MVKDVVLDTGVSLELTGAAHSPYITLCIAHSVV